MMEMTIDNKEAIKEVNQMEEIEEKFKEKFAKKVDRDVWKFNYLEALSDLERAKLKVEHIENLLGFNIMELKAWKEKYTKQKTKSIIICRRCNQEVLKCQCDNKKYCKCGNILGWESTDKGFDTCHFCRDRDSSLGTETSKEDKDGIDEKN